MKADEEESHQRDSQTFAIIGAAMAVHSQLGAGFLERVYQGALTIELATAKIPFIREYPVPVFYRGTPLECEFRADFLCYDEIIVELKVSDFISKVHAAQLLNYLKATNLHRGLLRNFGSDRLEFKRFVHDYHPLTSA